MTFTDTDDGAQEAALTSQTLDYEQLFERLRAGNTLITANSRLSRVLTGRYNQWRIEQGDSQWQSAKIISWNLWLGELWEMAGLQGLPAMRHAVPGKRQLISLWEQTLKNEPLDHHLLRPESLAGQLQDTRELMVKWQLSFSDAAWIGTDNENHAAFYNWNKAFEKRCNANNWISPEDCSALLREALNSSQLSVEGNFDLLGFDELDPSQTGMLTTLKRSGCQVNRCSITSRQDKTVLWKSDNNKQELQKMARWVRHWHETDPQSTIAIVVPDLQTRRAEVERQLEAILTPASNNNGASVKPWNISMGTPLSRVPMIETAFDLLKLLDYKLDIQDIGRVLRSPWLRGSQEELNNRALLEKCLRDKYPRQLKLSEVSYRASEIRVRDHHGNELPTEQQGPQPWNSPDLAKVINTLSRYGRENSKQRAASAWAESFDQLLQSLGWPLADEPPEDHDHNWMALQAWRDALGELASLDATVSTLDRSTAIYQLKQICRDDIFQARTTPAVIQVLGLYEVSSLRFDHLWVLGMHNDNWPLSARPNPFIPAKLQQHAQTPNSSPQRELEVARVITKRLLETSPDCVFSYPQQVDGEDVMPSPLLAGINVVEEENLPGWQGHSWQDAVAEADGAQLDPIATPGKLIHPTARGGSSILRNQALCPFRAFASNRLGADGLETPADGISAALHGSLMHSVLENFWKETKTQAALLDLDDDALNSRVRKHVVQVTEEDRGLNQRPSFRGVEADRLHRHAVDYLELDKQRDSFEVVGFEKEIFAEIEGQTIRLIIDRIDQTANGEDIIIDYKTGKVAPKKWFGDRPEEPQLPLYAIAAETTPAAVVFGIVRDDECLYKGVVQQEGLLPNLPPKARSDNQYLVDAGREMPETIEKWRVVLHHLMADFLAGEAKIDPKLGFNMCRDSYCDLQSLCRINELNLRMKAGLDIVAPEGSV